MARIMVVDDELLIRQLLSQYLQSQGHVVIEAGSGAEALVLALTGGAHPDLVLLDIEMPGLDGLDTLKRLRRDVPEAIVIMVSGINNEPRALRALEEGARDYISKPFDLRHLEEVVLHHLALAA